MKKIFVIISILCLALFLFACSEESAVVDEAADVVDAVGEVVEEAKESAETLVEEIDEVVAPQSEDDTEEVESESDSMEGEMEEEDLEEAASEPVVIETNGLIFTPDTVTISVGESVTFDLGSTHNAVEVSQEDWEANQNVALEGGFEVGFGATEEVSFSEAGTYYYICQPHIGMGMKGMIVVE